MSIIVTPRSTEYPGGDEDFNNKRLRLAKEGFLEKRPTYGDKITKEIKFKQVPIPELTVDQRVEISEAENELALVYYKILDEVDPDRSKKIDFADIEATIQNDCENQIAIFFSADKILKENQGYLSQAEASQNAGLVDNSSIISGYTKIIAEMEKLKNSQKKFMQESCALRFEYKFSKTTSNKGKVTTIKEDEKFIDKFAKKKK